MFGVFEFGQSMKPKTLVYGENEHNLFGHGKGKRLGSVQDLPRDVMDTLGCCD